MRRRKGAAVAITTSLGRWQKIPRSTHWLLQGLQMCTIQPASPHHWLPAPGNPVAVLAAVHCQCTGCEQTLQARDCCSLQMQDSCGCKCRIVQGPSHGGGPVLVHRRQEKREGVQAAGSPSLLGSSTKCPFAHPRPFASLPWSPPGSFIYRKVQ